MYSERIFGQEIKPKTELEVRPQKQAGINQVFRGELAQRLPDIANWDGQAFQHDRNSSFLHVWDSKRELVRKFTEEKLAH